MTDQELEAVGLKPSLSTTPPRGTGRTARQLLDAPKRSIFVVCHQAHALYVERMAKTINYFARDCIVDVRIVPSSWLDQPERLHGLRDENGKPITVTIDHSVFDHDYDRQQQRRVSMLREMADLEYVTLR